MDGEEHSNMRFQHRDGDHVLDIASSMMGTNSLSDKGVGIPQRYASMYEASNRPEPIVSAWDPVVSLNKSDDFRRYDSYSGPSYPITLENQGNRRTSYLGQYQSDSGVGEMVPKLSCFPNGSFPVMVNSFGLPHCGGMKYSVNRLGTENANLIGLHSQIDGQNLVDKASPDGKNKRKASDSDTPIDTNKNEEEQQDPSAISLLGEDGKKQKIAQNAISNLWGKQAGKQAKENSNSGDAPKEDYIHERAKRGQATNSHSLAERVRREKISERMRLLQDLVPGCNKITGKALMLDEIINYVQSLQQQVEFLSMKLAAGNTEVNIDIEQILSKDLLNSKSSNAAIFGFDGRPTHPLPHGNLLGIPSANPLYHSMPQMGGKCICGNRIIQQIVWTHANPGIRFTLCADWRCNLSSGWLEDPLCAEAQVIVPGLIRRVNSLGAEKAVMEIASASVSKKKFGFFLCSWALSILLILFVLISYIICKKDQNEEMSGVG